MTDRTQHIVPNQSHIGIYEATKNHIQDKVT